MLLSFLKMSYFYTLSHPSTETQTQGEGANTSYVPITLLFVIPNIEYNYPSILIPFPHNPKGCIHNLIETLLESQQVNSSSNLPPPMPRIKTPSKLRAAKGS